MFGIDDMFLGAGASWLMDQVLGDADIFNFAGEIGNPGNGSFFDGLPDWATKGFGNAIGGVPGYFSAQQTNEFNAEEAQKNRDFQSGQAQRQMDFQENQAQGQYAFQNNMVKAAQEHANNMSSTAHQREVNDLKKAGLNPMLSMHGGAQSPGVAGPSGGTAMQGAAGHGSQAHAAAVPAAIAAQTASTAAQVRNLDTQNELIKAQTEKTNAETVQTFSSAGHLDAQTAHIRQEMQSFEDRWQKIKYELGLSRNEYLESEDLRRAAAGGARTYPRVQKMFEEARELTSKATIMGLKIPEALKEATFFQSEKGDVAVGTRHAPNFQKAITGTAIEGADRVNKTVNSGYNALRGLKWDPYK